MARRSIYGYESIRGWAQGGELTTGGGVNGGSRGVSMQAALNQENSLTVQFNVSGPEDLIANTRAVISATLPSGGSVNRIVTVVDGTSITVRGMNVKVMVRDFTVAALSTGVEYQVDILATIGVRAANKQPPFLIPLTSSATSNGTQDDTLGALIIPAASSRFVLVPRDAGIISLQVQAKGSGGIIALGDLQVLQNTIGAGSQSIYEPREYDWVPLFPNVNEIQLNNSDAATDARFSLAFGIDG